MLAIHGVSATALIANSQNPVGQVKYIIHYPFGYVNVLWNTYFYTWGDNVTRSVIGYLVGQIHRYPS